MRNTRRVFVIIIFSEQSYDNQRGVINMSRQAGNLLHQDDLNFYQEHGYWISPKLISDERLEALRLHMDKVFNGEYETGQAPWSNWNGGPGLRQANNSHWADNTIRQLATDPQIGEIAAGLLAASRVRIWHDQLLYKPGDQASQSGANVGWHQDYYYWQCAAEPTLITAWVAFDDVTPDNGCMQVVPGSHRWGLRNVNDFHAQDLKKQEEAIQLSDGQAFSPLPVRMKAGQVSFHHSLTFHGSGPNLTDRPRRSLAIHLMSGDTRYKPGTNSDGNIAVLLAKPQDGELFTGEWFPVAYERC